MESSDTQLTLSAVEQRFAASGIDAMPDGVSMLTQRELKFVLGVLEHGQMAKAAAEAGYSADSAGQIASETLRKPKVFRFYKRCLDKVASQAELVVRRIYERSVIFHAKAMEAAQTLKDADQWLLTRNVQQNGRSAKDVKEFTLAQTRAQRDEKHYATLARAEDALLLNALGKLKVAPGGDVILNVVPDDVRDHLCDLAQQGVPVGMPDDLLAGRS